MIRFTIPPSVGRFIPPRNAWGNRVHVRADTPTEPVTVNPRRSVTTPCNRRHDSLAGAARQQSDRSAGPTHRGQGRVDVARHIHHRLLAWLGARNGSARRRIVMPLRSFRADRYAEPCTRIPPRHRSRRTQGDCRLAGPRAVRHRHVGRDAHRVQDAGIVILTLRL